MGLCARGQYVWEFPSAMEAVLKYLKEYAVVSFKNYDIHVLYILLNELAYIFIFTVLNRIGGVMVSVFASHALDGRFELRLSQTKDYEIGICCCIFARYASLRVISKDWLPWKQSLLV
jgi:hypothetical protein